MAKKFDEHLHVEKKDFDKGRIICMCETHKKRICHCGCEHNINPLIAYSIHKWGCYDQLLFTGLFTEQEVAEALKDYS